MNTTTEAFAGNDVDGDGVDDILVCTDASSDSESDDSDSSSSESDSDCGVSASESSSESVSDLDGDGDGDGVADEIDCDCVGDGLTPPGSGTGPDAGSTEPYPDEPIIY